MVYGYHFKTCKICGEHYFTRAKRSGRKCRDCAVRPELSSALTVIEYKELKRRLKKKYGIPKKNRRRKTGEVWYNQS